MPKPKAPQVNFNPREVIEAENLANRINTTNPFGSSTFGVGPDGRQTQTIEANPLLQQLIDRSLSLAGEDSQRFQVPTAFNEIGNALAGKVGDRLGINITPQNIGPPQQLPPTGLGQLPIGAQLESAPQLPGITPVPPQSLPPQPGKRPTSFSQLSAANANPRFGTPTRLR